MVDCARQRYNIDLGAYRRRFLARRIAVRMRARQVTRVEAYAELLCQDPGEYAALLDALNINLSYFMRDGAAYTALASVVLPALIAPRRQMRPPRLAVWSAGCATGEEPYSVAMLLDGVLGAERAQWQIRIDGVDRSAAALEHARRGIYSRANFLDPAASYITRYFTVQADAYVLDPAIRSMVAWHQGDIRRSPPVASYDLILCRNVLIYYVRERQEEIIRHLLRHLVPDGYLMLGMSEVLPEAAQPMLSPVNASLRIYRASQPGKEGL